ncbi:DUF748 domain-containing protein [Kordiimonas pumila]|uniref:AsmA domain-containing protein n=1 Tax=Kordiimonas pumila TaxID=2161677 RepID=A0ABV7D600_9PROT|nr:hypothetical protein [Kordiimonas pumila]
MKKILIVLLLVILAGGVFLYTKLDSIIKTGIETEGPKTLNVSVDLDGISLSPFSGKINVKGLELGQPNGFGEGAIASIGSFDMKVEPRTLMSNHIIIDSINIGQPVFDVRMQGSKSNIKALQDGLDLPATEPTAPEDEITLTIRSLVVSNPRILASSDGALKLDEDIKLADFKLTNLGTDEKGLAPREIARHVMDTLQPQITKALIAAGASGKVKDLADGAKDKLEKGLGGLLDKLKKDK